MEILGYSTFTDAGEAVVVSGPVDIYSVVLTSGGSPCEVAMFDALAQVGDGHVVVTGTANIGVVFNFPYGIRFKTGLTILTDVNLATVTIGYKKVV